MVQEIMGFSKKIFLKGSGRQLHENNLIIITIND